MSCPICGSEDRAVRAWLRDGTTQWACPDTIWHTADARFADAVTITGATTEAGIVTARRDHRIAVFETIGCALATLRRLDHVWYDEDVRDAITKARSTLSVAQSTIKERVDS